MKVQQHDGSIIEMDKQSKEALEVLNHSTSHLLPSHKAESPIGWEDRICQLSVANTSWRRWAEGNKTLDAFGLVQGRSTAISLLAAGESVSPPSGILSDSPG